MKLARYGSRPPAAGDRHLRVKVLIGRALRSDTETLRLCVDDIALVMSLGPSVQSQGEIRFLGKLVAVG